MKTRMDRYNDDTDELQRAEKNHELYDEIYNNIPSSNVAVLNNESEIDITKIKELVENREGYRRIRDYEAIIKTPVDEDDKQEEYDIYEDIDNKIYDINAILENARSKRDMPDQEKYRSLKNTQYDILSKLDLNDEKEPDEMVTDFFTQDKTIQDLMTNVQEELKGTTKENTGVDLFDELKGTENTILTEPVKEETPIPSDNSDNNETFYTNHLSFTKEDFEGFQNLQSTVKSNNKLIKVLITILGIALVAVIVFLTYTML